MAPITSLNKVKQTSESVLSDRVDKIENDVIEIKGNIKKIENNIIGIEGKIEDLRRDAIVVFFVASTLFVIRSEVKMAEADAKIDKYKEEVDAKIDKNKAEADAKMAEADAKMDRNFIITNSISATSLLISLVMTLAAKK